MQKAIIGLKNRYGKNGYGKRNGKDRTSGLNQAGRREEEKKKRRESEGENFHQGLQINVVLCFALFFYNYDEYLILKNSNGYWKSYEKVEA